MKTKYIFGNIGYYQIANILLLLFYLEISSCTYREDHCFFDFDVNDIVVYIPVGGCGGCIDATLSVVKEFSESSSLKVIVGMYRNNKEARILLGDVFYQKDMVILYNPYISNHSSCDKMQGKAFPMVFYPENREKPVVIKPHNASRELIRLKAYLSQKQN